MSEWLLSLQSLAVALKKRLSVSDCVVCGMSIISAADSHGWNVVCRRPTRRMYCLIAGGRMCTAESSPRLLASPADSVSWRSCVAILLLSPTPADTCASGTLRFVGKATNVARRPTYDCCEWCYVTCKSNLQRCSACVWLKTTPYWAVVRHSLSAFRCRLPEYRSTGRHRDDYWLLSYTTYVSCWH